MVFRQEYFFGVMIRADATEQAQEFDITPGEVELVIKESAAGAGGEKMVIVMPFTRHISGP